MALAVQGREVDDVYQFILEHPRGVTQEDMIAAQLGNVTQITQALNLLAQQRRVSFIQLPKPPGGLLVQAEDPNSARQKASMTPNQHLIYQLVERQGDRGAWSKTLREQSKLPKHIVEQVTQELLQRQMIKEVKTSSGKNRKVYMLFNTEPASDVVDKLDVDRVDNLRERCLHYVKSKGGEALKFDEIYEHVGQHTTQEMVQNVLRTLELDEEVVYMCIEGLSFYAMKHRMFDVFGSRVPSYLRLDKRGNKPPPGADTTKQCPLQDRVAAWIADLGVDNVGADMWSDPPAKRPRLAANLENE
jgi:DNA-directed RNA polymerase III subunit RPC6